MGSCYGAFSSLFFRPNCFSSISKKSTMHWVWSTRCSFTIPLQRPSPYSFVERFPNLNARNFFWKNATHSPTPPCGLFPSSGRTKGISPKHIPAIVEWTPSCLQPPTCFLIPLQSFCPLSHPAKKNPWESHKSMRSHQLPWLIQTKKKMSSKGIIVSQKLSRVR